MYFKIDLKNIYEMICDVFFFVNICETRIIVLEVHYIYNQTINNITMMISKKNRNK